MLAKAASMTTDPDITWLRADLETLQLPAAQSDVIYSSLALHYLRDIPALFATLYQALVPGGRLVFRRTPDLHSSCHSELVHGQCG